MKRVLIAIAALLLVTGLCGISLWRLCVTHRHLTDALGTLETVYTEKGIQACVEPTEQLCREIETHTDWMSLFFHQNLLNEITESCQLALIYAEEECGENFLAQLGRCRHALDDMYTLEFPTWTSIF